MGEDEDECTCRPAISLLHFYPRVALTRGAGDQYKNVESCFFHNNKTVSHPNFNPRVE